MKKIMKLIVLISFLLATFSCRENRTDQTQTEKIKTYNKDNKFEICGTWYFKAAGYYSDDGKSNITSTSEKNGTNYIKKIILRNDSIIIPEQCSGKIYIEKISIHNYYKSNSTCEIYRKSIKSIFNIDLPDSIISISNYFGDENVGCEYPYAEILYIDEKIIVNVEGYLILFVKNPTSFNNINENIQVDCSGDNPDYSYNREWIQTCIYKKTIMQIAYKMFVSEHSLIASGFLPELPKENKIIQEKYITYQWEHKNKLIISKGVSAGIIEIRFDLQDNNDVKVLYSFSFPNYD